MYILNSGIRYIWNGNSVPLNTSRNHQNLPRISSRVTAYAPSAPQKMATQRADAP